MKILWLLLLLSPGSLFCQTTPCSCEAKVGVKRPYRLNAKWDTSGGTYPRAARSLRPSTLHTWEARYSSKANGSTVAWNTDRLVGTPEESLYTMKGYLWFVKVEVDCDYHIQIGRKNKGAARRAVVELTTKQCTLQQILLDSLMIWGYTKSQLKKGIELESAVPVTVQGLGFYDWQHQLKEPDEDTDPNSPLWKQEGTAWELHPVISFTFDH